MSIVRAGSRNGRGWVRAVLPGMKREHAKGKTLL